MRETAATAARETIADLCDAPPAGADELIAEVAGRVRKVVPFDEGCWMGTDPITRLPTTSHSIESSPELGAAFCEYEMRSPGDAVNDFDALHASGLRAASLVGLTGGDLQSSLRYREIHARFGLRDELRMLAGSGGSTWAYGCMTRAEDVPDFTAEEVRWVASISQLLGRGIRTALTRMRPPEALPAPGMLVLDGTFQVEASTGAADGWLDAIGDRDELPKAIITTAMAAQAAQHGDIGRAPVVRLPTADRGWLLVHADALSGDDNRTAVMLESADRASLLPLLLALHGLSDREKEITQLLVAGHGTDHIAATLHISRHTLRDHVKAIFAKVGVSSRPELTAALA